MFERVRHVIDDSPQLTHWAERMHVLVYGPPEADEPRRSEQVPWQAPSSRGPQHWQTALYALSGFLGGLVIAASAPRWYLAVPTWRITLPGVGHPGSSTASTLYFLLGLILLGIAWLGLIHRAGQHVVRIVEGWPGSDALLEAYRRIALIT